MKENIEMNTVVKDQLNTSTHDQEPAQESLTLRVVILPEPAAISTTLRLSHYEAAMLSSRLADDLALATWEDAEWR